MAQNEHTGWSLDLVVVRDIPVRVHYSFFLLPLYVFLSSTGAGSSVPFELCLLFMMVISIALHELSHALTARSFGIETRDIVLYPFGGIATIRGQAGPKAELLVAIAGPVTNLVIALCLFPLTAFSSALAAFPGQKLITYLFIGNIVLAVFNLLPALPMDGGRMFRAVMMLFNVRRATLISGRISQALSTFVILFGLYYSQVILTIIGVLVFAQASQEIMRDKTSKAIAGLRIRDIMIDRINIETLFHGMSVAEAVACLMKSFQDFFPVMHSSQVVGIVARDELLRAAASGENQNYIAEYMQRDFDRVGPDDLLSETFGRLVPGSGYPVLVFDRDGFAGLVLRDAVSELLFLDGFRDGDSDVLPEN